MRIRAIGSAGRRLLARFCHAALAAALLAMAGTGASAKPVELELILAIDVSASVRVEEFDLQMRGYAEAFRTPQLIEAIKTAGGIAVTMMQWANPDQQDVTVAWTHVYDETSAEDFAKAIDAAPRLFEMGQTAMGHALEFCLKLFPPKGYEGRRKVIDVSGDGYSNKGILPNVVRDRAIRAGVTINGLPITNKERFLAGYYERNVIGGAGSFMIVIKDYTTFSEAIVTKLIREVRGQSISFAPDDRETDAQAAIATDAAAGG
ncbi:MAG: DUF1194 domain-containing protein [Alphaproteobacteria bacterium]